MKKIITAINPSLANKLLEQNLHNRKLKESLVDQILNDIENGNFDFENTYIVLNEDGTLSYGQHTLNAIIKYGKEFSINVITLEKDDNHLKGYYNKNSKYKY